MRKERRSSGIIPLALVATVVGLVAWAYFSERNPAAGASPITAIERM